MRTDTKSRRSAWHTCALPVLAVATAGACGWVGTAHCRDVPRAADLLCKSPACAGPQEGLTKGQFCHSSGRTSVIWAPMTSLSTRLMLQGPAHVSNAAWASDSSCPPHTHCLLLAPCWHHHGSAPPPESQYHLSTPRSLGLPCSSTPLPATYTGNPASLPALPYPSVKCSAPSNRSIFLFLYL